MYNFKGLFMLHKGCWYSHDMDRLKILLQTAMHGMKWMIFDYSLHWTQHWALRFATCRCLQLYHHTNIFHLPFHRHTNTLTLAESSHGVVSSDKNNAKPPSLTVGGQHFALSCSSFPLTFNRSGNRFKTDRELARQFASGWVGWLETRTSSVEYLAVVPKEQDYSIEFAAFVTLPFVASSSTLSLSPVGMKLSKLCLLTICTKYDKW